MANAVIRWRVFCPCCPYQFHVILGVGGIAKVIDAKCSHCSYASLDAVED